MSHMNGGVRGVEGGVRAEGEMDAVLLGRTKNLKVIYLLLQPLKSPSVLTLGPVPFPSLDSPINTTFRFPFS